MKQILLLTFIFLATQAFSQTCIPSTINYIEGNKVRYGVSTFGNFCKTLEYPKRTLQEINSGISPIGIVFDAGVWLVAKNQGVYFKSCQSYSDAPTENLNFFPGPISLQNGAPNVFACSVFDKIWKVDKSTIDNFIYNLNQGISFPIANVPNSIKDWPAKGNKQYTTVLIEDDLAPFVDYNGNGIYDPEYGDYPSIKGDECTFTVFNDMGNTRHDTSMGVEIHLMSYLYKPQIPSNLDNTIYYDYKVNRKKQGNIDSFVFSLFYDVDLGYFGDDYAGCYSSKDIAYVCNGDNFDDTTQITRGYGKYPPVFISQLLQRKMGAHNYFLNNANPNNLPSLSNANLFDALSGKLNPKYQNDGNPYMQNTTISDIRSVQSYTTINLKHNTPEEFSFKLFIYQPKAIQENFIDSIDIILDTFDAKNKPCPKITFQATIFSDTNNLNKGKIDITAIKNAAKPYSIRWSSSETVEDITNKDSGYYRITLIDANNCFEDTTLYIPMFKVGTGSIHSISNNNINIYPNPASEHIIIAGVSPSGVGRVNHLTIKLTNLLGQEMAVHPESRPEPLGFGTGQHDAKGSVVLDIRDLSQGIYLLTIADKENNLLKQEKIVIER